MSWFGRYWVLVLYAALPVAWLALRCLRMAVEWRARYWEARLVEARAKHDEAYARWLVTMVECGKPLDAEPWRPVPAKEA